MPMVTATPMAGSTRTDMTACPHLQSVAPLRLMQLVSPALPIGGFTYSQGLEYAVEAGWVTDVTGLEDWLCGMIEDGLETLEIPVLARLYRACQQGDRESLVRWGNYLVSCRETSELRLEEQQRARALTRLLVDLGLVDAEQWATELQCCQTTPFALAAVAWQIPLADAALGFAWSWLENQVAAAIKLIPLGQTDGQRVLLRLAEALPPAVQAALVLADDQLGACAPFLAIASSRHETQYTRLFRS